MGRPRKYYSKEEIKQSRRNDYKKWYNTHKWYCDVCDKKLCMSARYTHPKTIKHLKQEKYQIKNEFTNNREVQN